MQYKNGASDNEAIKKKIRAAIEKSGLTKKEISAKMGVSSSTVAQYVSGKSLPDLKNFVKLCEVLHVRSADLLGLSVSDKGATVS